jgi:glycosyltransferase involved in cell wall biosynthesis
MSQQFSCPSLSVAVPTFKRPALLSACIESVLAHWPNDGSVELMVIDNDPQGSAAEVVECYRRPGVIYLQQPRPGVVHARNAAIEHSKGDYLAFIDDDEVALPGWLAALKRHVEIGVDASFGPVRPVLEVELRSGLAALAERIFTRDLSLPFDEDVGHRWPYLGSGNSLFSKERCFRELRFDERFNMTGGEDTWLIRLLVERGRKLLWNSAAAVTEFVSADRLTVKALRDRRVRQGQNRVLNAFAQGGWRGLAKGGFFTAAGAAQFAGHSGLALLYGVLGTPRWQEAWIRAGGGEGKVLWRRQRQEAVYAAGLTPEESIPHKRGQI